MKKLITTLFIFFTTSAFAQQSIPSAENNQQSSVPRPNCEYNDITNNKTFYGISKFYTLGKQEMLLNKPIKNNSVLYYSQFIPSVLVANTSDDILDKDASPFNPNMHWSANKEKQVPDLISWDKKTWWYFIPAETSFGSPTYWVSDKNGWLCGNPLSFIPSTHSIIDGGMPRVYQKSPIKFSKKPIESNVGELSLSMSMTSINGATGSVLVSINKDGGSVFSTIKNVDLLGDSFNVLGIKFKISQKNGETLINQIILPDDLSIWVNSLFL